MMNWLHTLADVTANLPKDPAGFDFTMRFGMGR
jgi:hypothetical protein